MRTRMLTAAVLAGSLVSAGALSAKDVYKPYLDPSIAHHRAALDTLEKLKANPNDPALHNDLGCLIARDGFWKDALGEFDEAARLDKKDSKPLFNAGLVHAARGEWRSARSSFKKAVNRDRGNWTAWWMLGYAEERLGNVESAVGAYGRSLRVDTGLFDVARNPFAADSRLKARVLLETYETRLLRASLPGSEQIEQPARIGTFFQRSGPARVTVAEGAAEPAAPEPVPTAGPVVTTAPAPGAPGAPRGTGSSSAGDRIQFRPIPPRTAPQRPTAAPNEESPQGQQPGQPRFPRRSRYVPPTPQAPAQAEPAPTPQPQANDEQ